MACFQSTLRLLVALSGFVVAAFRTAPGGLLSGWELGRWFSVRIEELRNVPVLANFNASRVKGLNVNFNFSNLKRHILACLRVVSAPCAKISPGY